MEVCLCILQGKMKPGGYIATALDNLYVPHCSESWIKGKAYKAMVDQHGAMYLQGELTVSYYSPEAAVKLKNLFQFVSVNHQNVVMD